MADGEVSRSIGEALNEIVKTTDKSGNMKKKLKKTIYENVSTLRNLFVKMKEKLEEGMRLKEQMDNENNAVETELDVRRRVANNTDTDSNRETSSDRVREPTLTTSRQVQPSHGCRNANSTSTQNKRETPIERETITPNTVSSQQRPSIGSTPRLYSDVAAERNGRKFKLTVTTKRTHTPDEVQNLLKEKVKLTDIKVGVQSLKTLRDAESGLGKKWTYWRKGLEKDVENWRPISKNQEN
jgi:hypothetical protein